MKASRELDIRVTRIVFGIKEIFHNEQNTLWSGRGKNKKHIPYYSIDTNDTEKMLKEFAYYEITKVGHNKYAVSVWSDDGKKEYRSFGDTLGEAACNAALKAFEYKENKNADTITNDKV